MTETIMITNTHHLNLTKVVFIIIMNCTEIIAYGSTQFRAVTEYHTPAIKSLATSDFQPTTPDNASKQSVTGSFYWFKNVIVLNDYSNVFE